MIPVCTCSAVWVEIIHLTYRREGKGRGAYRTKTEKTGVRKKSKKIWRRKERSKFLVITTP